MCNITLCADIQHTQGAAETALLSYLTLAVRARLELPEVRLCVTLPTCHRQGIAERLPLGRLFTQASLDGLARAEGFEWVAATSQHSCSRRSFDVRVGVVTTTLGMQVSTFAAPPAPNYTRLVGAPFRAGRQEDGRHQDPARRTGATRAFHEQLWPYLRSLLAQKQRSHVRACLLLYQGIPGPLAVAAAVYPAEQRRVRQKLLLSPGTAEPSAKPENLDLDMAASSCAYLYLSDTGVGSRPVTATFAWDESAHSWKAHSSIQDAAKRVVDLALADGLKCAVVNALPRPSSALQAIAPIFERYARRRGVGDFRVLLVPKIGDAGSDDGAAEGAAEGAAVRTGHHELSARAQHNIHQRFLASRAPLFITDVGTHWADWLLDSRLSSGLPFAVLYDQNGGGLAAHTCDPAARLGEKCDCAHYYRAMCLARPGHPSSGTSNDRRAFSPEHDDLIDYLYAEGHTAWAVYESSSGELSEDPMP